ncbi:hypothetical protein B0H14DRAFT_2575513 [Mycena olivaceomarginata]|nr:hypothetical protein B0H14DRAFT_2575513 [Mycena olivaceomarginata]
MQPHYTAVCKKCVRDVDVVNRVDYVCLPRSTTAPTPRDSPPPSAAFSGVSIVLELLSLRLGGPLRGVSVMDVRRKERRVTHVGLREACRKAKRRQRRSAHCQYSQSTQLDTGSTNKTEKPTHVDKVGLVPTLSMSVYGGGLTLGLQTLGMQ